MHVRNPADLEAIRTPVATQTVELDADAFGVRAVELAEGLNVAASACGCVHGRLGGYLGMLCAVFVGVNTNALFQPDTAYVGTSIALMAGGMTIGKAIGLIMARIEYRRIWLLAREISTETPVTNAPQSPVVV